MLIRRGNMNVRGHKDLLRKYILPCLLMIYVIFPLLSYLIKIQSYFYGQHSPRFQRL